MSTIDLIANQQPSVAEGEVRNFFVDMFPLLEDGELLSGTPTVRQINSSGDPVSSGDLTITLQALNTAAKYVLGREVAISEAAEFRVAGFLTASTPYYIEVKCNTTESQTIISFLKVPVAAHPHQGT